MSLIANPPLSARNRTPITQPPSYVLPQTLRAFTPVRYTTNDTATNRPSTPSTTRSGIIQPPPSTRTSNDNPRTVTSSRTTQQPASTRFGHISPNTMQTIDARITSTPTLVSPNAIGSPLSNIAIMSPPPSNRIITPQQEQRVLSPVPEQPILINGQPFDPNVLSPIVRPESFHAPVSPESMHMPQQPVVEPEKKTKVKKTKKVRQPKPLTWEQVLLNYKVPDYKMMSDEMKRMYRNDFKLKFNIIKTQFPELGVTNYAEDESISLDEIHVHYMKIYDQIGTKSNADWYKKMLVFGWLGVEWFVSRYLGLKSGGYAYFQSRNMSKYDRVLEQLGEINRNTSFDSWSPLTQIMIGSGVNLVIFVIIQTFLNNMSEEQKNNICNMVGSFFTNSSDSSGPPELIPAAMGALNGDPGAIAGAGSSFINNPNGLGNVMGLFTGLMGGANNNNANSQTNTDQQPRRKRQIED